MLSMICIVCRPAIEEVGESEGVGMWGGEEEVETGSDDTTQREDTTTKER